MSITVSASRIIKSKLPSRSVLWLIRVIVRDDKAPLLPDLMHGSVVGDGFRIFIIYARSILSLGC